MIVFASELNFIENGHTVHEIAVGDNSFYAVREQMENK